MNRTLTSFKALFTASLKMYYRNKGAVIFTLIVPMALLGVFGFLSKSSGTLVKIDVTNYSNSQISQTVLENLKKVPAFKITETTEKQSTNDLSKGNIDLQVIVPKDFGEIDPTTNKPSPSQIITHYNQAKPQNGQAANLIISEIISQLNNKILGTPQIISVESSGVQTNNLTFFDFILPGILAMSIMQLGIFGTAFAFVSLKASGALRRIQATPIHPRNFILAQAATRLIITLASVLILVGFGKQFFGFHMLGSYFSFLLVGCVGSLIFLGLGFAIAGVSKDENQVAPLANLIQLPMLLLSGVFFPRDNFPHWLKTITDYFPLTFMADALRKIANEGVSLFHLGGDLLGLGIWMIVVFIVAINVFRWE
jgi:ABC-2 type transport system permease protein